MLILLMIPVLFAVAALQRYLTLYAPSNVLTRHVRRSPAHVRTALMLVVLAGALLVAMHAVHVAIREGAPGWLNLVVLILAWDFIKLICLAARTGASALAAV